MDVQETNIKQLSVVQRSSRAKFDRHAMDIERSICTMLEKDPAAYTDILGEGAKDALWCIGWHYLNRDSSMVLLDVSGKPLAIGWAKEASHGINLSYATAMDSCGQGFARLITAATVLDYVDAYAPSGDVRVCAQFEIGNIASHRVAFHLGLKPDENLSFESKSRRGGPSRSFIGTSAPLEVVAERCRALLSECSLLEKNGALDAEMQRQYPCVLV